MAFIITTLFYILGVGGAYYVFLPPINFTNMATWVFLLIAIGGYGLVIGAVGSDSSVGVVGYGMFGLSLLAFVALFIGSFFNSKIFRAKEYANMIEVEELIFEDDFPENDTSGIPLMDRDTAERLGNRQIGGIAELVSQFVPADDYTQINIEDIPYRVSPLEYASISRWFNNRTEGIPGYMKVNMVDGDAEMVRLDESIKYSDSEYLGRDVKRFLRFQYPTVIFGSPSFEVNDDGHPYYVATTYDTKFFMNHKEPNGVITLNAVTGEAERFELDESPKWIDRVYSAKLVIKQLDDYGSLKEGYLNSKFGRKGVTRTTSGYNYLSIDGDIYLYTGVTSINTDASNIGFYLVNMRTKEAQYYPVVSADEDSAAQSAIGAVQHMDYTSTFPILISLEDRPYYLSSLKDNSGLVRLYALVDAQDYQKVYTHETIDGILDLLAGGDGTTKRPEVNELESVEELEAFRGQISEMSQAVVSGNTVYYFLIDGTTYKADVSLHDDLPFIKTGMSIDGEVDDENNFEAIYELITEE